MKEILCSTGALIGRPNGRDFNLLSSLVPQLECDGLELLMYDTWYDKTRELCRVVKSLPKPVLVFHLEKSIGEFISYRHLNDALAKMELNCFLAKEMGAKRLVLHLWNGIISDKNIEYNIACYENLEEIAAKHELLLTVENVVCSVADPMSHWCALIDKYPHIKFTYDTKMADFHKQQDLIFDPNYRHVVNNIAHFHINDRLGEYKDWKNLRVLHVGRGSIDFEKIFALIKTLDYQGAFTTEATSFDQSGTVDIPALNRTFDKIRAYIT